jgi:hypothetical protein
VLGYCLLFTWYTVYTVFASRGWVTLHVFARVLLLFYSVSCSIVSVAVVWRVNCLPFDQYSTCEVDKCS